jgi:peptidoglycan/LPS O-acetylase OafA/YrhL
LINVLLTIGTAVLFGLMVITPDRLKSFGARRRSIVTALVSMGLCSFFLPLIAINPPVLGRDHWSAFTILSQLHAGALRVYGDGSVWMSPPVVYLVATYAILSAVLLALMIHPSPMLVGGLAASVPIFSVVSQWGSPYDELRAGLRSLFYGDGSGLVDIVPYVSVHMIITIGVLTTIYFGALDE